MLEAERELQAVAHHEAGHAVMCCRLGIEVSRVSIMSGVGRRRRRVQRRSAGFGHLTCYEPTDLIMVALAGRLAEERYRGRKLTRTELARCSSDDRHVSELAQELAGDMRCIPLIVAWLEHRAKRIHRRIWREVSAVARALTEEGTISGQRLRQIVRDSERQTSGSKPLL